MQGMWKCSPGVKVEDNKNATLQTNGLTASSLKSKWWTKCQGTGLVAIKSENEYWENLKLIWTMQFYICMRKLKIYKWIYLKFYIALNWQVWIVIHIWSVMTSYGWFVMTPILSYGIIICLPPPRMYDAINKYAKFFTSFEYQIFKGIRK